MYDNNPYRRYWKITVYTSELIMNRVVTHEYFLRYLSVATSYQRRHLLQAATTEQLNVLYEIAFNVLQGNISLTDKDYTRLYKHRVVLRKLSLRQIDIYTKRRLLGKHSLAVKELLDVFFHYFSASEESTGLHFKIEEESEEDSEEKDSEEEDSEEEEKEE